MAVDQLLCVKDIVGGVVGVVRCKNAKLSARLWWWVAGNFPTTTIVLSITQQDNWFEWVFFGENVIVKRVLFFRGNEFLKFKFCRDVLLKIIFEKSDYEKKIYKHEIKKNVEMMGFKTYVWLP